MPVSASPSNRTQLLATALWLLHPASCVAVSELCVKPVDTHLDVTRILAAFCGGYKSLKLILSHKVLSAICEARVPCVHWLILSVQLEVPIEGQMEKIQEPVPRDGSNAHKLSIY